MEIKWESLQANVSQEFIKQRPTKAGGPMLDYIEWGFIAARLNEYVGPINWRVRLINVSQFHVHAALDIRVGDEWETRENVAGVGTPQGAQQVEDMLKIAATEAMKRCAQLGWCIGDELYKWGPDEQPHYSHEDSQEPQHQAPASAPHGVCDKCHQPLIKGRFGPYCKPCWQAGKSPTGSGRSLGTEQPSEERPPVDDGDLPF